MKEIWKSIPGWEDRYMASNMGRVKSIDSFFERKRNGKLYRVPIKGTIRKLTNRKDGYIEVILKKNGSHKTYKVHQLVAMAFLGHKPCGLKLTVNHKDEDKTNNIANNLEVVTCRYNISYSAKNKYSDYTGVSWSKPCKKWTSRIVINKKEINLGLFENELDAAKAYKNALIKLENGLEVKSVSRVRKSKYKGVSKRKNKKYECNHKGKYIGTFNTEYEAYLAREKYVSNL